jgi:glycosyltransferase involved in cell wall biosynthesis
VKRVLYVVSNVTDSTEYELLVRHWDRKDADLEFVFLNRVSDCSVQRYVRSAGYTSTTYIYNAPSQALRIIWTLMKHLRRARPDIIHTNLLDATFFGLIAGWLTGIGKRVYTRHHSTHNHKYHPIKGVLYDRLCNALAHRIVAISLSTKEVLLRWEGVPEQKVVLIYHGYEMQNPHVANEPLLAQLEARYQVRQDGRGPVVGIISRPFAWKGLDHSIRSLMQVSKYHPRLQVLLFNWKSTPDREGYERLLAELPLGAWRTVDFEPNVVQLFHTFDVFVHVPEDQHAEAFGLVYAEALMSGVPCVFTRSGIMHDLDAQRLRGVSVVPFKDAEAIAHAIRQLTANPLSRAERRANAEHNTRYLFDLIDVSKRISGLRSLYTSL